MGDGHAYGVSTFEFLEETHQSLSGNVIGEGGGQCKPDSAIFAAKTGVADKSHGEPHSQCNTEMDNAMCPNGC